MSSPLAELTRLKAEYEQRRGLMDSYPTLEREDAEILARDTFHRAVAKHADWLLSQARENEENRRDREDREMSDPELIIDALRRRIESGESYVRIDRHEAIELFKAIDHLVKAHESYRLEAASLRKDAERYKWLRQEPGVTGWTVQNGLGRDVYEAALDAAIDAQGKG